MLTYYFAIIYPIDRSLDNIGIEWRPWTNRRPRGRVGAALLTWQHRMLLLGLEKGTRL